MPPCRKRYLRGRNMPEGKLELLLGAGAALHRRLAELAPGAGEILALALVGQLCFGLEGVLRPGVQLVHRDRPGGHILPAGLVDAHAHLSDVVEGIEQPERAKGIQHHLEG